MAPVCGGLTLGYFLEPLSGFVAFRGSSSGEFDDTRPAAKKQKIASKGAGKRAKKDKNPKKGRKTKKKNPPKS